MGLFEDELRRNAQRRAQINAEEQAQQAAIDYNNRLAAAKAQKSNKPGGLAGVLSGIGESINNTGKALVDLFGGMGVANLVDAFESVTTGKATNKHADDFKKWVYGTDNMKDAYMKAGGAGLDAAATVADFIPGLGTAAKVGLNVGQGAASGFAQEYINNGANANFENALKGALAGAAGAGVGQGVGAKLANKVGGNKLTKALYSNVGKAALTGAASGATGAGLSAALNGADLGQTLGSAFEGAGGGAIGGATLSGLMGLTGKSIDRIKNKVAKIEGNVVDKLPANTVAKVATVDEAQTPTRRGIAVTDYDAGEQRVKVNRPNQPSSEYSLGKNAGSTLDGVLGPDNARKLPNAKQPTDADLFRKQTGGQFDNAADYLAKYPQELEALKQDYPDVYQAARKGAQDWADLNALQFEGTGATNKSNLPDLNRQQYYEDTIGKVGKKSDLTGAKYASYEDVPDYMRNHLLNDTTGQLNGKTLKNDDILREFFRGQYGDSVDSMDLNELYSAYERLAQAANQNEVYTPENISNGIRMNDINDDVTGAFVRDLGLRQQIGVDAYPSLRKPVEVALLDNPANTETVYTKRTIAPKTTAESNLPAKATQAQVAPIEETPLIQKGTPEYNEMVRQEVIANRRRELENQVVGGILDQYGTVRLNDSSEIGNIKQAAMDMANLGLTQRSQIDGFTKRITGADGEIPKVIRKSLKAAGDTNGRLDITMDEVFRQAGISDNKNAQDKAKSFFQSKGKKYSVDQNGNMSRLDMYDFGKELEKQGWIDSAYADRNGTNEVMRGTGEALKILGQEYIAKASDGVDIRSNIDVNKLKNILPGNEKWAAQVDNFANNVKTVQDARSFISSPTKMSLWAQAEDFNVGTYGQNVGNTARDAGKVIRSATSANPIAAGAQMAATKVVESKANKQRMIKNAIKKIDRLESGKTTSGGLSGVAGKIGNGIGNIGRTMNNDTFSSKQLASGLTIGDIANREIARQSAIAESNNVNNRLRDERINQEMLNAQNDYNAAMADAQAKYQAAAQQPNTAATVAQEKLDRISSALDAALAAGDITAYGQLANLYKQAYNIYGPALESTQKQTETKALSANQSKALAASQQLEQLAQMTPDAGTAIANSPLGFLVNLGGGNEYANQAKALSTTLGYLLSGANIKESEAERIGQSYVPNAFDSEAVRQQKIARARQLIQSYLSDTGAIEA